MDHKTESLLRTLRREAISFLTKRYKLCVGSPLQGYCVQMSLLVCEIAGGDLMFGYCRGCAHYWNRLPCGTEIDLTSCQFDGDGWNPICKGEPVGLPGLDLDTMLLARALLEKINTELAA